MRVVILGGGFTGLRIACLLERLGHDVTLIEAAPQLGGMVASFEHVSGDHGRFLFDFGPHLFFREYLDAYRELLGDDMLALSGRFTMCLHGATLSYPLRPAEMPAKLGLPRTAAYVANYLAWKACSPIRRPDPESLRDELSQRFGRRLFDDFYAPYIEKCCGLPIDETDVEWALERQNVSGRSLASNLLNKVRAALSARVRAKLGETNDPAASRITAWYPRLGSGQLIAAMEGTLKRANIRLGAEVVRVSPGGSAPARVDVGGPPDGAQTIEADLVVSTLPLPTLARLIDGLDPAIVGEAAHLNYRRVRLVNLILDQPRALDSMELFSMDPGHLFKRAYEPKAMSAAMAPDDKTSLCLEVCCTHGDHVAAMPGQQLVDDCVASLVEMGVVRDRSRVLDSFLVDLPHAYPIYKRGFKQHRQRILDAMASIPDIVTCGRQGIFRYHSMTNEVMETADSIVRFVHSGCQKQGADNRRSPWGQSFY